MLRDFLHKNPDSETISYKGLDSCEYASRSSWRKICRFFVKIPRNQTLSSFRKNSEYWCSYENVFASRSLRRKMCHHLYLLLLVWRIFARRPMFWHILSAWRPRLLAVSSFSGSFPIRSRFWNIFLREDVGEEAFTPIFNRVFL